MLLLYCFSFSVVIYCSDARYDMSKYYEFLEKIAAKTKSFVVTEYSDSSVNWSKHVGAKNPALSRSPNIILIIADDLGIVGVYWITVL